MNAMVARSALLSVLVMAATSPVTAGAEPYNTTTERFHCYRIQAGDSAADVAKRLTGHRGNLSGSSFQIFDAHRQLVTTDHYDRISPGWTVCLAEGRSPVAIRTESPAAPPGSVQQPEPSLAMLQLTFSDPDVWWVASLVLAAMTSLVALNSWRKQLALAHIMRRLRRRLRSRIRTSVG